jgi:hypothetical protein
METTMPSTNSTAANERTDTAAAPQTLDASPPAQSKSLAQVAAEIRQDCQDAPEQYVSEVQARGGGE